MKNDQELRSRVFQQFKTVCDKLLRDLNRENIRDLTIVTNSVPEDVVNYLSEYVFFPIQFHLLKYNSNYNIQSGVLIDLVQCLNVILPKIVINSLEKFINLNGLLLRLITNNEKQELEETTSEDLKYEIICCVSTLYKSLDSNIEFLEKLYNCKINLNIHAQAVYVCTQISKHEQSIKLRVQSLKCLLSILRIHDEQFCSKSTKHDGIHELKWHVAEILASMFPGIASTCYSILSFNSIIHRDIYIFGLRVFCRCISLIFEDDYNFSEYQLENIFQKEKPVQETDSSDSIRSSSWCKLTEEKLKIFINCLAPLCDHQQPKVREELVKGVSLILKNCFRSLNSLAAPLTNILVILSLDDIVDIAEQALYVLNDLLTENSPRGIEILGNLEENFLHTVNSVCCALNYVDENVLLSRLKLLNGLLRILDLERIFTSSVYIEELVTALISIVRFDTASVNTFDEHGTQDLVDNPSDSNNSRISWKNTKYLSSNTEPTLLKVFDTISQRVNLEYFTYHLLDTLKTNIGDRKELLYLINHISLTNQLKIHEKRNEIAESIADVYLDPIYSKLSISDLDSNKIESVSLNIIRNNLLQICLLTEGIGMLASQLETDFKSHLIHCLYLIVERAGSPNKFLCSIGLVALQKISVACDYSEFTKLISNNADFIIHHAILKLRNMESNTRVFDVFCIIIAYSHEETLLVLCDVIQTLLKNDKIVQDKYSAGFLRVFNMFIQKLRCWFVPSMQNICSINESADKLSELLENTCQVNNIQNSSQMQACSKWVYDDELVDLKSIFKSTEYDFREGDTEDELPWKNEPEPEQKPETMSDQKKEPPQHIKLVTLISQHILHIFPHRNITNKILIVEILINSLFVLHNYGEDELLPTVHKLWEPLVNRFEYDKREALLMRRCVELLCVMATTAKDFIRSRTLKSVQPVINEFLIESSKESRLKDKKSVYRTSQKYKLQYTLLKLMGFLVVQTDFQEKEVNAVLEAVTPYLSSKQPLPLQDACIKFFNTVASKHNDFVLVHLLNLYLQKRTLIPGNVLEVSIIKLKQPSNPNVIEFQKNVYSLLKEKILDKL